MSEAITLARPYAKAVFELAREQNDYAGWSKQLGFVAGLVADQQVKTLLDNPKLLKAERIALVQQLCGADAGGKEFNQLLMVLVENQRLSLLPEIAELYEKYRAAAENTIEARIVSAQPVPADKLQALGDALAKRLGCEVSLQSETDESLIGGAVIHAGDLVIDGSVKGQLSKLSSALIH